MTLHGYSFRVVSETGWADDFFSPASPAGLIAMLHSAWDLCFPDDRMEPSVHRETLHLHVLQSQIASHTRQGWSTRRHEPPPPVSSCLVFA